MPVTTTSLPKETINLLRRNVSRHLQTGRIQIAKVVDNASLQLYIFPISQITSLHWEADSPTADGYLVFIGYNGDIYTAMEFFLKGKRFHHAHSIIGPRVDELVGALNGASTHFEANPSLVSLSFAGHFLAESVILRADIEGAISFYENKGNDLTAISTNDIATGFDSLRESRLT